MLTDLWRPILIAWCRKIYPRVRPCFDLKKVEGLKCAVPLVNVLCERIDKDGLVVTVHDRLQIIYRDGLDQLEMERTVAHEFGHVVAIVLSGDSTHGYFWNQIVRWIGYPEEAAKKWPDVV